MYNAWQSGTFVDGAGAVWINAEHLASIWRTDKATAEYFVAGIQESDKANFGGVQCIKYSAVIYRLNEFIQGPIDHKRREYLRVSEQIGQRARDADPAEVIRMRHSQLISDTVRELKKQRMSVYGIMCDELTRQPLGFRTAEFHHIRRQSISVDLISMIWNGLIVDRSTHNIITERGVCDERQLLDLCRIMGWDTAWFDTYLQELQNAGL
ncbi:hypothetical protein [Pseudomonas amygdali]|uniref:hypothetical protein n=1 Tax=Pseudomonas amygdali TaxID=47877 RepID=UPI0005CAC857|nr:hypothetical protein [Pseudomonas amygdali]KWS74863.1 hypothetical protein AL051_11245 [Pseudomonas amygdali pv. dendropanacis]